MKEPLDLLIFPGGGSPANPLYHQVYELLEREAKRVGYEEIYLLTWPGHCDKNGRFNGELTMEGAKYVAEKKILELEKSGKKYHVLGRSFGIIVALDCVDTLEVHNFTRLILWGPPPYWLLWELFKKDFHENKQKNESKGLNISGRFFEGVLPVEYLLKKMDVTTIVATGAEDTYSTPQFLHYLQNMYGYKYNLYFRWPIRGCKHEVTEANPNWKEYIKALFYEKFL